MNKQHKEFVMNAQKIMLLIALFITFPLYSLGLLRPFNILVRPQYTDNYRFQLGLLAETGISDRAFNDERASNVLRIWNCDQDALAMLDGFPVGSPQSQKRLEVDANNDGTRGHFFIDGDMDQRFGGAVYGRLFFRQNWSLSLYMPFYSMRLKNVQLCDRTQDITDEDVRVKELLTDDIVANMHDLGDGLCIGPWDRSGPGDATLFVEWFRDFAQAKQLLKSARVSWRAGVSFPTGFRRDEDKLFAIPFGNDGAFAIPFGMGLDLTFAFHVRAGFNVTLTHTFANTRQRRIKTAHNQTDLFLLKKTDALIDWGLRQNFSLYTQLYRIAGGFSCMLGYEYIKHNEDKISLCGNEGSSEIANTAQYLQDRTLHEMVVRADYDVGLHLDEPTVYPRFSFYSRIPFNGKRSFGNITLGLTFSLDF